MTLKHEKMGENLRKFNLLMWKNFMLIRRHVIHIIVQLLIPIVFCFALVGVRSLYPVKNTPAAFFKPLHVTGFGAFCGRNLAYAPNTPFLNKIIKHVCHNTSFLAYKSSDDLNSAIKNHRHVHVAIVFHPFNKVKYRSQLPVNVKITIRPSSETEEAINQWLTHRTYPLFESSTISEIQQNNYKYFKLGFLQLQRSLTFSLMTNWNAKNVSKKRPDIIVQRYPYPEWCEDDFYESIIVSVIPIILIMCFMYTFEETIVLITIEKDKQLKEYMKIIGVPGSLHWLAWFLRTFILLLIINIEILIIFKVNFTQRAIFTYSDISILLVFFTLFSFCIITFAFLVGVFCSKANTAATVGGILFLVTFYPYMGRIFLSTELSSSDVLGWSVLSNMAMAFGISGIIKFEIIQEGAQWSNLFTVLPSTEYSLGHIMMMFILDALLYLLIALYVEAIYPGEYGVPKPWHFPVTSILQYCKKSKPPADRSRSSRIPTLANFEEVKQDLTVGIELEQLSKTYGTNRAVRNLNFEIYEGQITILLGHNGSGKTTTMNMITGMLPPTNGTVIVGGYDVRKDLNRVRDSIGLCLQTNMLFDSLTVQEHLYFFSKLKGLQSDEISQEIDKYLDLLALDQERNTHSKTLSGGMKRRLSVAVAFCGKSKVVILDEPTSEMDPSVRRSVWNLLKREKKSRTILMTTQFMEEADLLGDRIAIMSLGRILCCGSGFFLKKRFGAGYYLVLDVESQCNPNNVTDLLRKHIATMQIHSQSRSELTYQLPANEIGKFEGMLSELENNLGALMVRHYTVRLTSLEDVFMTIGAEHAEEDKKSNEELLVETYSKPSYLNGYRLITNQILAMVLKKFYTQIRSWRVLLLQIILPAIFLATGTLKIKGQIHSEVLEITLDSYQNPIILLSGDTNNDYYKIYKRQLQGYEVREVRNISEYIFGLAKKFPLVVRKKYILGASFNATAATAWFNGDPLHSSPLALSLILNAFYKKELSDERKSITFINHPIPLSAEGQLKKNEYDLMTLIESLEIGDGMIWAASLFILFPIKERISKSKHLQLVSGVNPIIFWSTSFLSDFVTYIFTCVFVFGTIAYFIGATSQEIAIMALLFICFAFFVLPFLYIVSYLFDVPSTGFSIVTAFATITVFVGVPLVSYLEFNQYNTKTFTWVLFFVPFYAFVKGLYDFYSISEIQKLCRQAAPNLETACKNHPTRCCDFDHILAVTSHGVGLNILISFLMFFTLFAFLVIHEYGGLNYIKNKRKTRNKPPKVVEATDDEVAEEIKKIKQTPETILKQEYALVLRDVTKYYGSFLAVNGLCLGIKTHECFGLLGVNGAGKSTTFGMMTGDTHMSFGDIWVEGISMKTDQTKVLKLIGYCPGFDALLDDLTVKETMKIFALIRGIPLKHCNSLADDLGEEFDLSKHIKKKIKQLSGDIKRKVNAALAVIGDPLVIYLDEPTTGMDPATKRYLWRAFNKLREKGKCIVLTSQSMEECEVLCTRIAIMVDGSFKCLGSSQRLKSKYTQGYTLNIKMKQIPDKPKFKQQVADVDTFIKTSFPGAEMKEKFQGLLSYRLMDFTVPCSKMFGILEINKKKYHIEDYSLGHCTLEQVFLSFSKHQT